ncbi:M20/M25/M40 family metallo-hydrolase [Portibacter marinus]|uniref:M20/M25/M40 family metallo-hydrolase n=1 Tax=Portibacter marinus TaxID=2898660 RepID=UPI001F3460A2|nr:M20/M25/M40 family metallo-hydrolase [Portibacter marinus]
MKKFIVILLVVLMTLTLFLVIKTMLYQAPEDSTYEHLHIDVADEAVQRFAAAIRIPTISYPDRIDTSTMESFLKYLSNTFPLVYQHLEVDTVSGFSLIFKWKGSAPTKDPALFLAHMDVVPIDEASAASWQFEPFAGTIQDGYILGRGTMDDKGSVISILESTERLLKEGFQPRESIYFAFGHDEEVGGNNGAVKIAHRFQEQGQEFSFIIDEGLVVITDGLSGIQKPIGLIGLAEKGAMSMTLSVDLDKGGHAMMPPKETAITILSDALVNLKNHPPASRFNASVEKMFEYIGPEMKWPEKLFFANQWLFRPLIENSLSKSNAANALIKTTLAPTIIKGGIMDNVLPSHAEATINVRIVPGETVASVVDYVRDVIDDPRVKISAEAVNQPRNPTAISPTTNDEFKTIRKSIYQVFGDVVVAPGLVIGGTDSRHYAEVSDAIYRFMPVMVSNVDLEGIHGVNEKLSVENYKRMVAFYENLIKNFNRS